MRVPFFARGFFFFAIIGKIAACVRMHRASFYGDEEGSKRITLARL